VSFFVGGQYTSGKWFVTPVMFISLICAPGLPVPLHVINITQVDGLLDVIALGNIIEFAVVLDFRTYEELELDDNEYLEREAAMTHYRTLITWFSNRYGLRIGDNWVNPSYLFKRELISFGATLGAYFARSHPTVQRHDKLIGISPLKVQKTIQHHIQTSWAHLVPAFEKLAANPPSLLSYSGPAFRIFRTSHFHLEEEGLLNNPLITESHDYEPAPIYVLPEATEELHPGQKRTRVGPSDNRSAISPPSSPSQKKVLKRRKQVG
jgi:hypothetical protein